MLKLGTQNASALYLGGQTIKKAYLGGELVFSHAVNPDVCNITASIDPTGSGSVTGTGQYQKGESVTVRATPGSGYKFSGWYEGSVPKLPAGYTELEYIQSDSNCSIDTEYSGNFQTTQLVLDIEPGNYISGNEHIFGTTTSADPYLRVFRLSSTQIRYRFLNESAVALPLDITGTRLIFDLDFPNSSFTIGETSNSIPVSNTGTQSNIFLFGFGGKSTVAKLYSCKIYNNSTVVRDFIPCKDPTGNIGLYDLAGNKFYSNTGEGSFTTGPEIPGVAPVSQSTEYTFTVTGDVELVAAFGREAGPSRLPDGYTEVEYIESDGSQYINTNVSPYANPYLYCDVKTIMDVQPSDVPAYSTFEYYFGAFAYYTAAIDGSTRSTEYAVYRSSSGNRAIMKAGTVYSSTAINGDNSTNRVVVTLDAPNKIASIDTDSVSIEPVLAPATPDIILLAKNCNKKGTESVTNKMKAKLFSCKIEKGGALVRDFVPCINPSGAVGVYDMVNSEFYGNAGTGAFAAGPTV